MICAVILAAALIWYRYRISHDRPVPKIVIQIIAVTGCVGMLMSFYEYGSSRKHFDGIITRPGSGEGDAEESFVATYDNTDTKITVPVTERQYSAKERDKLLTKARKEIDETFAGKNQSLDHVTQKVVPKAAYQDGSVSAEWTFDRNDLVDTDGNILWKNLQEDSIVEATVSLSCQGQTEEYTFPMKICLPSSDSLSGMHLALEKAAGKANQEHPASASFSLPEMVNGKSIHWKKTYSWDGEKMALLGVAAAVAMLIGASYDRRKKEAEYHKALDRDYPGIVSELSMYVGAGVSVRSALWRMQETYQKKKAEGGRSRAGYEQIAVTCRQLRDGMPEKTAYDEMGERCNTAHYRKLSLLLSQNLRQGNARLTELLVQEESAAEEMQRLMARAAGEEASTKLLIPMVGLLGVVMAILIIPAMLSMQ